MATLRCFPPVQPTAIVAAHAAVHGYTTALWWAAGIFAIGALITGLLLRGRTPELAAGNAAELQPIGAA